MRAERAALAKVHEEVAHAPAHPAGEAGAPRRILLAVDGSEHSSKAVHKALAMRQEQPDPSLVEIHLANVQPPVSGDVASFVSQETLNEFHHERSEQALHDARDLLRQAGVAFKEHEVVGNPGPMIAELARSEDCDLIVMGTRGLSGAVAALLGSVGQSTIEHTDTPVLLVK